MNDEENFLQAIAANPADDTLKLIYADWLEEHGDPRAELIRLEHVLGPRPLLDPQRLDLADRLEKRGNREMADFVRFIDPQRRAEEAQRRALLAGIGVGWLAVVGQRGPCLCALAPGEQVVFDLISEGCFHHDAWTFIFAGPKPLQAEVSKPAILPHCAASSLGTILLTDQEVEQLDALLDHYRLTTEEGDSTTRILFEFQWFSGGKKVHQDSFVDRHSRGGERHLPMLWKLVERVS